MSSDPKGAAAPERVANFIRDIITDDLAAKKNGGRVATRFPPEPNGYLHIGHVKAICIDFGMAKEFGGICNLRYDDTNPAKEEVEYVQAIENDVRWLGFQWDGKYYASDYFDEMYRLAEKLIESGKAYVDSLSEAELREYRGDYYKKGKESPFRNRPIAESLDLFRRMRAGEFKEGEHVLRAKIDLSSQNMNMRDPILYRIKYAHHHNTGDKWCIYPLYDYAHPLSDAIEKITHSLCTLEFEAHRPLYDWVIEATGSFPSKQYEFAKLQLSYTLLSKRRLLELVQKKIVAGWDDPRMPTIAGMRRRGYTAEALRSLIERIGVAKADSVVDVGLLEYCVREDLNRRCARVMGVVRPLKVVIDNFPEGEVRELEAPLHPEDKAHGSRKLPFSRTLYVERDDFKEDPPKDWFRLAPGREVRLRYGALVKCTDVKKDARGEVTELRCTMDPQSWGGVAPDGRNVKGTLHWVSAAHAIDAEVRLYDRLWAVENPGQTEGRAYEEELNPKSLEVVQAKLEPHLAKMARPGERLQLERLGYFCFDKDSTAQKLVLNRTVGLKDTWAKIEAKAAKEPAASAKPVPEAAKANEIGIEEFQKLDLRVGVVRSAVLVPEANKLLKLEVDLGEAKPRQVFAGLRASYPDPSVLVGKRVICVANLKPRQMKFGLSEAMVLAAGGAVATFDDGPKPGDKVQ
jgi:glutaminyl-tRNA synthetase